MERNQAGAWPIRWKSSFIDAFTATCGRLWHSTKQREEPVEAASRDPKAFHFIDAGLRRVAVQAFPYHFLYEENERVVRFLVLRHDKRHPDFGLKRR